MSQSQPDLQDSLLFVKVFYENNIIYLPILKSTPVLEIKRCLIPYTQRKIKDMKLFAKEMGEILELKKFVDNGQNIFLILRDPTTGTFETVTELPK